MIERLILKNFRSHGYLDITLHGKHIILSGPNGAGKTNILEAISLLSPGRGLRKAKISEILKLGQESPWSVFARIHDKDDVLSIATGQDPSNPLRRKVKVEGAEVSTHLELNHFVHINWITPAMDRLFLEPSSHRRKFFDRLVYGLDPSHAHRIANYEHAMKERNKLLKERSRELVWLDTLELTMAQESVAIASRRLEALSLLQQAQSSSNDAYFPAARLEFTEGLEMTCKPSRLLELEETLIQQFAENRHIDALMGGAHIGAHKMDFTMFHPLKHLEAALCSTGEQKILLIWMVLAFVKLQTLRNPAVNILLLDEVAAHLDVERREALTQRIESLNLQAWYTGTDTELFRPLAKYSSQIFHLDHLNVRTLI